MSHDTRSCRQGLLLTALVISLSCALSACNFSDPLTGPPTSGCRDDGDCENHGLCEIENGAGECACDPGYAGDQCDECQAGYEQTPGGDCVLETPMTNNNTTNNTTNNGTTVTCEDDEILVDGACIADGCASNPCGDGTCSSNGDGTWECSCPNGSTGIECPSCAAGCINGTCDVDGACVCDQGWTGNSCNACAPGFEGAACDRCAANAFGANCDTCSTINGAEAWWDTNYQARQALIVYNPSGATQSVLEGVVVQHTFAHSQLVSMGADPLGADVRVVESPDVDSNRVLGFDSTWNKANTTIWFPTATQIPAGGFDVFYLYSRNPTPAPVLNDRAAVLRQDRGWYSGQDGPLYSASALSSGEYSIQLRQKNPNTLQVYFHDGGNNTTASAVLRLVDPGSGIEVASVSYGASQGSSAAPADIFEELTGLPNSLRVDVIIDPGADFGLETATVYMGADRVQSNTTSQTYRSTLSRANNPSASPSVFPCTPELAP